jgi:ATP-binding cassette subfamily B (MDR/TAP) protein 7
VPSEPQKGVKPESIEKPKPAAPSSLSKDGLLAEKTASNAEQRKADWAIMKEMSKYLWPKNDLGTKVRVGVALALLVGSKVTTAHPYSVCV